MLDRPATLAFRADPCWLGGDDAYSIPLGNGRRLWLFGDSFVADTPVRTRHAATFVHNTVAIQHGERLAPGTLTFSWGHDGEGRPASFFPDRPDGSYLWPGHGAVVDGTLLIFFMVTRNRAEPIHSEVETLSFFDSHDWTALAIDDPASPPSTWQPREVARPVVPFAPLVGSAGVVGHAGHLYAYAVDYPTAWVCRWPATAAAAGDLRQPMWWDGPRGWVPTDRLDGPPTPVLETAETEFTVHGDPTSGRFVQVQMSGLTTPRLQVRTADTPYGPWTAPRNVDYVAEDAGRPDRFCYAGKAHPGLSGDGLVATHNAIHVTLDGIAEHPELYWPRVVRIHGRP